MAIEQQSQSRREFLSSGVLGIASVAAAGATPGLAAAQPRRQGSAQPMQRTLGRTGIVLPVMSIGAMNSDSPALYHRAYELGVRHFDTASNYLQGRSEEIIGSFVRESGAREDLCIATKIGYGNERMGRSRVRGELERAFEASMRRLGLDYVDILYYHGRGDGDGVNDDIAMEFFAELQQQGRIRWPGISTHSGQAEVLDAMAAGGFWSVALVSFNVTMAQNQALLTAMRNAARSGIGIVGMKALGGGRRAPGAGTPDFNTTAMLKWVLHHEEVTTLIPGMTTFDQLDLDWSVAADLSYTDDERRFLSQRDLLGAVQFCQQCEECVPTCPKGADVPTLMRTYMYAAQYANFAHARLTLDGIAPGRGITACGSCAECTARCSSAIDIGGRIGALKSMYVA